MWNVCSFCFSNCHHVVHYFGFQIERFSIRCKQLNECMCFSVIKVWKMKDVKSETHVSRKMMVCDDVSNWIKMRIFKCVTKYFTTNCLSPFFRSFLIYFNSAFIKRFPSSRELAILRPHLFRKIGQIYENMCGREYILLSLCVWVCVFVCLA